MTVKIQRIVIPTGIFFLVLLLSGCGTGFISKIRFNEFDEQLYVDAKLNFTIKHPQNWKRIVLPVSSPEYRSDTVIWQIENPRKKSQLIGSMVIQSHTTNSEDSLPDLLSDFLTDRTELKSSNTEQFEHPVGPALKLLGHDVDRGRLTIAIKGKQNDFIISLSYPNTHFDELLPIFNEIIDSFSEIVHSPQTSGSGS